MTHTIQNAFLAVTVSECGAELQSIQDAHSIQYLWQGDPKYWSDRSPVLFPFIGRLTNNSYKYMEKDYTMSIHGFAATADFAVVEKTQEHIVLKLDSTPKTYAQYPFDFSLSITYALCDNALDITYQVMSLDSKTMPFAIGGHPGFNVPLVDGESFEDYELAFAVACRPDRVVFSPAIYLNGQDKEYLLREERFLDMRHDLFSKDAVILKNMAREVTLRSKISGRGVTVSYPDMPYLGIWHWPGTEAPYVCVEPWSSLPSRQNIIEEISYKSDLIYLASQKTYKTSWSIVIQ